MKFRFPLSVNCATRQIGRGTKLKFTNERKALCSFYYLDVLTVDLSAKQISVILFGICDSTSIVAAV